MTKARQRGSGPRQDSLFPETGDPRAGEGSALVRIPGQKSQLSREQQRFNELSRKVDNQRKRLADWKDALEQARMRMEQEGLAVLQAFHKAQREVVLLAHLLLTESRSDRRMTARRREGLRAMLCRMARELLECGHERDPELERLLEVHDPDGPWIVAQEDETFVDARSDDPVHTGTTGAQHGRAEEELDPFAGADDGAAQQREHARARHRAQRQDQQRVVDERLERESIREVYRQLASELHPDRETDPDQKARKTNLMQKLNRAYRERDLLTLLELQLEIQQIDSERLGMLPESQLARFNEVLQRQSLALNVEIRELERHAASMGHFGVRVSRPSQVGKAYTAYLRQMLAGRAEMERLHAALTDPMRRHRTIDEVVEIQRHEDALDEMGDELLEVMLAEWDRFEAATIPRRRRR